MKISRPLDNLISFCEFVQVHLRRNNAFRIQYPDGEEKYVEYDKKKYRWDGNNYYLDEDDVDFTARSKVLQNIVNELEDKGYFVENEILSRFMNWKISMMIMQKRGK